MENSGKRSITRLALVACLICLAIGRSSFGLTKSQPQARRPAGIVDAGSAIFPTVRPSIPPIHPPGPLPGGSVITCKIDRDCPNENCVDGYCCDQKCEGNCRSCAIPGHLGVCTAVPDGQDPRRACQVAVGGTPACGGVCYSGQCAFLDTGTPCGLCKACDGVGRCNRTPSDDPGCGVIECHELNTKCRVYDDLRSNRCAGFASCKISNDPGSCTYFHNIPCN